MILKVATPEFPKGFDAVVCLRADIPTRYTDNKFSLCANCTYPIQFRPDVPLGPKVCFECFMEAVTTK